jgi:ABC-type branched-subunit amino acid transport system permease subunit
MPEKDFVAAQVEPEMRGRRQRLRDAIVAVAVVLGLYAVVMVGLIIERLALFVAYLVAAAGLTVLVRHRSLSKIRTRAAEALRTNGRTATVMLVLALASYPILLRDNPYLIQIGALSAIYVVMALGLNITLGYAGLLDIGFAVYFGAGAYTSAQLAIHFGLSFWAGAVLGGLCASLFGFVVAWPALRVHDHYLGLVTLGYGLMMNLLMRNLTFLTNGTDGVINIPPPAIGSYDFTQPLSVGPLILPFQANFYYLAVVIALVTAFFSYRLRESNLGRAWEAIREDEIAARCSGVNARGLKILAFSTGAFFGGIGGAIYAHMIGFIGPDSFTFLESMTILVMVVIGGAGTIFGVALGAIALIVLPERFREFAEFRLLFFGAALVLLMIYRPEGLFPRLRGRRLLPSIKLDALLHRPGAELRPGPDPQAVKP